MKTSFYFVFWILIYPILALLNNDFINSHSFLVALISVFALSWLLKQLMPNIFFYEEVVQTAPIAEDTYKNDITAIKKRLSHDGLIETVIAVYFTITFISTFLFAPNWFELALFGIFAFATIARAYNFLNAKHQLSEDPTPETCVEVVEKVYNINYEAYYNNRQNLTYAGMFPPRPKRFKAFQIASLIIAIVCTILGQICFGRWLLILLNGASFGVDIFALASISSVFLLYGSLALYFGIKDIITSVRSFKFHPVSDRLNNNINNYD